MKTAARLLRAALAAVLFATPAFSQYRAPAGAAVSAAPRLSVVPSAPGAMSALAPASLGALAGAPALGVSAAAVAAPSAVPAACVAAAVAVPIAAAAAPVAVAAPAAAPALRGMDALPAAIDGRVFDGASVKAAASADEVEVPEDLPTDVSDAAVQMPELFVTRESRNGIRKGAISAHVGLIKSKGSEWYWGKFKKGALIAVKSGMMTLFVSKVENAKTVKIASLQRKDFEGLFTPQRLAGKSVYQLRNMLVQELKDRQARRPGAPTPVSTQSQIRLVRFMSSVKSRSLPENNEESAYPVTPRPEVKLPEALQGLHHMLPKVVLLDMRLFADGVPYPLIEDMSKLMKSGVYFVLLSDKQNGTVGSVDELLSRKLTIKQRDQITRYKMLILSDDGNSLSGHSGSFSKPLPSRRFTPQELEIMSFVASTKLRRAFADAKSTRFELVLQKGTDAAAAKEALFAGIRGMRLDPAAWQWDLSERDGRPVLTIRPQSLVSAMPHLFEVMRDHEGLFVNNSDVMVISRDQALLQALPGVVAPAAHLSSEGETFADESLASLIGPYRVNQPGDLAASASKISSFLQGRSGSGFDGGNIYMLTGHVMHSAFNWAVWVYRNTGKLPSAEELVDAGRKIWEVEAAGSAKNLLGRPGESLAGFYETIEQRLRAMHQIAADVLKVYPIAIGTELPNMAVVERWKKGGVADHRDIFRLIFDFVVARETKDGKLEVVIVDFKTGQVPTLQNLEKDTQVQLYDLLVRQMWKTIRLPYGGTGQTREISDFKLNFLYTAGAYQPILNDWSRLKFDKFLKNVMNRIRKQSAPPAPKAAKTTKKAPAKKA